MEKEPLIISCPLGHEPIPNSVFYSLTISDTNITQYAMCLNILHRTYGEELNAVPISLNEFAAYIKEDDPAEIKKQLQPLIDRRIVFCLEVKPGNIGYYKINPDITQWDDKNLQNIYGTEVWRKLLANQHITEEEYKRAVRMSSEE
ncbi:MAG: hypothetical protein GX660_05205 [Clostridiaceae bacterium]|nr:hypothetical protein [Clostridiaceae bacterium]